MSIITPSKDSFEHRDPLTSSLSASYAGVVAFIAVANEGSFSRAADRLGDRAAWTPLTWLGNSHHHIDFAGTMSADPRTYLDTLNGLIDAGLLAPEDGA